MKGDQGVHKDVFLLDQLGNLVQEIVVEVVQGLGHLVLLLQHFLGLGMMSGDASFNSLNLEQLTYKMLLPSQKQAAMLQAYDETLDTSFNCH